MGVSEVGDGLLDYAQRVAVIVGDKVLHVLEHDGLGTNLVGNSGQLEEQVAPVLRVGEALALALNRKRLAREPADDHVYVADVGSAHLAHVAHVAGHVEVQIERGRGVGVYLVGVRGAKPAGLLETEVDSADAGEE